MLDVCILSVVLANPCNDGVCQRPVLKAAKAPVVLSVEVVGNVVKKTAKVAKKPVRLVRKPLRFTRKVGKRLPVIRRFRCR